MTVNAKTLNISDVFPEWTFTPFGGFRNKKSGRVLTRKDWEIEMSYEHVNNPEVLELAKAFGERAAKNNSLV